MEKSKDIKKDIAISVSAFLLPALIMLLIFIAGDFAPFGKVSILVADMQYQFVDYIGYLKQVFFGNDDLFYSFSKTFGGDMSGFASYYLNNPFFLILVFVPNDLLPIGIVWMMVIICGGCGLTCNLMFNGIWESRKSSIIFSTSYAMMGYMMAYINCIHYFFSVMLLPLVILGLFKVIRTKKLNLLYVISVSLSIISCYYIGYMILIFTAVFYLVILFSDIVETRDLQERIKISWTVLYSTLLAIGVSVASLFTVVMSLRGQKSSGLQLSLSRNFRITEFFSGLYSKSFHGNISDGLPIIYSGVVTVVFLFLYFLNKTVKLKEKILVFSLMIFMIAGFWIDALNVAWHGFAHPIGFPYRNSFLFSFIVIFFGYKGYIKLREGFDKRHAYVVLGVFLLYSLLMYLMHSQYADLNSILFTLVSVLLTLFCVTQYNEKDRYIVPVIVGLFVIQIIDLYGNGSVSVDAYFKDKNDESVLMSTYKEYVDDTQSIVDYIEENDNSFFRMDKLYRRTHNDPMMFGYNGLSHFSSCETDQVKDFMGRIGFRNNKNWAFYGLGNTTFADSLMGVKYILSQYDGIGKPYLFFYNYKDKIVFQNPLALSLGFGMKDSVKKIDMEEKDPFILQNRIAENFTGTKYEIYRPVNVSEIRLNNVTQDGNIYRRNSDEEASVEYVLSINSNNFIYMYFDAPEEQKTLLNVNGMDKQPYFTIYDWSVRECGYFEPGEEISVKIILDQDEIEIDDYYFYYENPEILIQWYKDIMGTTCDINKVTSSHLYGEVNIDKESDLLVFTIPYEKDWIIKLDGQKVNQIKVMDALTAIEVSEGKHTVEMRYIPRGIIYGLPISIISIITIFCVLIIQKKRKTQL